ncbi:MAG: hypothetical protein RLY86_1781, partial [Pseudomonadota bacterium]
ACCFVCKVSPDGIVVDREIPVLPA